MRFDIHDDVFGAASHLELLPLFHHAFEGRHRALIVDEPAPAYEAWLAALDHVSNELCREAVSASIRLEASEPAKHIIRVARVAASRWNETPPVLTLADAVDLGQRPYRLLLEHSGADRAFLLSMATEHERAFLQYRIGREWLEVESCGGIDGLAVRAGLLAGHQRESLRCSAMFDSDAPRPGHPSAQAIRATTACARIHHRQLMRRAIENYVPLPALYRWARRSRARARKVRAFSRMSRDQQSHYHMKQGLPTTGDSGSRAFYANLSARDVTILGDGIGDRLSQLFVSQTTELELQRDGGWTELRPFVEELVERVR